MGKDIYTGHGKAKRQMGNGNITGIIRIFLIMISRSNMKDHTKHSSEASNMSFDDLFRMLRTLRTRLKRTTQANHSNVTDLTLESNRLDQVYSVMSGPPALATNISNIPNMVPFNTIQHNTYKIPQFSS